MASAEDTLHLICREGNLRKVQAFVGRLRSKEAVLEELRARKGASLYTPLHEASHKDRYEVLEYLLALAGGSFVNECQTSDGSTLLHVAAASGYIESVRVLLRHKADTRLLDSEGKTALHRAEQCNVKNQELIQLLKHEELIQEVETNGPNVTRLLKTSRELFTESCLNQALLAAVRNDSHAHVSKLVLVGATNTDQALITATEEHKQHARGMLLLCKVAQENDFHLLHKLYGEPCHELHSSSGLHSDRGFSDVQRGISSGGIMTVVPMELARRKGYVKLREELLVRTDVNKSAGTVHWHGLRILSLETSMLQRVSWVKKLKLNRNSLESLPCTIGAYLTKVTKLDLSFNDLQTFPPCLLELPCIQELNVQSNKLTNIPEVLKWSPSLVVLDLSHNQLTALPEGSTAPGLASLDLSHNKFRYVPPCVCAFTAMTTLDISWNTDIQTLPNTMGILKNLTRLNMTGLPNLRDLPESIRGNCKECIRYLRSKLRGSKLFRGLKVVVMGCPEGGKSTLIQALCEKERSKSLSGSKEPPVSGFGISTWHYSLGLGKRPFTLTLWELGGSNQASKVVHSCFLSNNSLHLLVFNLLNMEKGLEELKPWLSSIALHAPKSPVMIVGTHLDRLSPENQQECHALHETVAHLRVDYPTLLIQDLIMIGLSENLALLKQSICNYVNIAITTEGQAFVDRIVPESYHRLYSHFHKLKEATPDHRPVIMNAQELQHLILQLGITDIQDSSDLADAILFLTEVGCMVHCNDKGHDLHALYFTDPGWLYTVLLRIVDGSKSVAKRKGVLESTDIPHLLLDAKFPWEYYVQLVALLAHFEIALPLSNEYILVPSALPEERPDIASKNELNGDGEPPYTYCISIFPLSSTPTGLWGRLLAQVFHFVPQVYNMLLRATHLSSKGTAVASQPDGFRGRSVTFQVPQSSSSSAASASAPLAAGMVLRPVHPPSLLPSFPGPLPCPKGEAADVADAKMEYWQTGLFFSSPEVTFCLESLSASTFYPQRSEEGILITSSRNKKGLEIACRLLELTDCFFSEWYPDLQIRVGSTSLLDLCLPCYLCRKMQSSHPWELTGEDCMSMLLSNNTTIQCKSDEVEPSNKHSTPIDTIAPHLLFLDCAADSFLVNEEIELETSEFGVIGKGAFSKVYQGDYKHKPVAVKQYRSKRIEAFIELRREVNLLLRSKHPCIVRVMGVCVYPSVALIMEKAPMGSLDHYLVTDKTTLHRIVIYRIAAQVASTLSFLHTSGVILRNLRPANILIWCLSPSHLCLCKLCDFDKATYLPPYGTRGLLCSPGFTAPEALHISKDKCLTSYTHKIDIFSFGMLLYQLITGRKPYHELKVVKVNAAVEAGERPSLHDAPSAKASHCYLANLMQKCWDSSASVRPEAERITQQLCLAAMQLVKAVHTVRSIFSLRHTCVTTYTYFGQDGGAKVVNELLVCSDSAKGTELNVYSLATMSKSNVEFIHGKKVQCVCLCGDHLWVACTTGIEYGELLILGTSSLRTELSINLEHSFATCIASTGDAVLVGTATGQCFLYNQHIEQIQVDSTPLCEYNVNKTVNGIVVAQDCIWISHAWCISLLQPANLILTGTLRSSSDTPIGQLLLSTDKSTVWSTHQTSPVLSAWDARQRVRKFEIDIRHQLSIITGTHSHTTQNAVITAVTPAVEMVWVGTSSGHILMFQGNELLNWCQPYSEYIRFLTCVPSTELDYCNRCTVVSGAKGFHTVHPLLSDLDVEDDEQTDSAGVLIVWEAYDAKTMRQLKIIEDSAPDLYGDYDTLHKVVVAGGFEDDLQNFQSGKDTQLTTAELDSSATI